jgi:4-hydroxy-3-methylbut-2-en-1-yl diphosphate reductase
MKIIRADHLGMCFGVRDAITLALEKSESAPLTILGELVHNETVLETLRDKGIQIKHELQDVATDTAMITAHGASESAISRARNRGLNVIEATCPLVHFAHRAVARLVGQGYHPIIIGRRDHVEVRGVTEDLVAYDVILSEADIEVLQERPRFGVAAQTTQPVDRVQRLLRRLRQRFPMSEVRYVDTVCQPTKQRQTAAQELAQKSDVVVIIGGSHSNNTRELVATANRFCPRVYHVQGAENLRVEWFQEGQTVGLTAGTSTPDSTIDDVEDRLRSIAKELEHRRTDSVRSRSVPVATS